MLQVEGSLVRPGGAPEAFGAVFRAPAENLFERATTESACEQPGSVARGARHSGRGARAPQQIRAVAPTCEQLHRSLITAAYSARAADPRHRSPRAAHGLRRDTRGAVDASLLRISSERRQSAIATTPLVPGSPLAARQSAGTGWEGVKKSVLPRLWPSQVQSRTLRPGGAPEAFGAVFRAPRKTSLSVPRQRAPASPGRSEPLLEGPAERAVGAPCGETFQKQNYGNTNTSTKATPTD
jgi:hypothetical protein